MGYIIVRLGEKFVPTVDRVAEPRKVTAEMASILASGDIGDRNLFAKNRAVSLRASQMVELIIVSTSSSNFTARPFFVWSRTSPRSLRP